MVHLARLQDVLGTSLHVILSTPRRTTVFRFVVDGDTHVQVLAKFLAPPGRLADLLAIAGDKSDGIVGAEGYGPVKAAKVHRYGVSLHQR